MEFGELARCRTCHGSGESRDSVAAAMTKYARKKAGVRVLDTCVECGGSGYVPVAVADNDSYRRPFDQRSDIDA